jgi:hypothetical protein
LQWRHPNLPVFSAYARQNAQACTSGRRFHFTAGFTCGYRRPDASFVRVRDAVAVARTLEPSPCPGRFSLVPFIALFEAGQLEVAGIGAAGY